MVDRAPPDQRVETNANAADGDGTDGQMADEIREHLCVAIEMHLGMAEQLGAAALPDGFGAIVRRLHNPAPIPLAEILAMLDAFQRCDEALQVDGGLETLRAVARHAQRRPR